MSSKRGEGGWGEGGGAKEASEGASGDSVQHGVFPFSEVSGKCSCSEARVTMRSPSLKRVNRGVREGSGEMCGFGDGVPVVVTAEEVLREELVGLLGG